MLKCMELLNLITESMPIHFKCEMREKYLKLKTPFVYPDGDYINVFVLLSSDEAIVFTDFGETFRYLDMLDINLRFTKSRQQIIDDILLNHNVKFKDGEIYIKLGKSEDTFFALTRLLQAISRIADLVFTVKDQAINSFNDKVIAFFEKREINFVERYPICGNSGKAYHIDFYIPDSKKLKLLKTLSMERVGGLDVAVNRLYTTWSDVSRKQPNSIQFTLLDDEKELWKPEHVNLLSDVSTVLKWSNIEENVDILKIS